MLAFIDITDRRETEEHLGTTGAARALPRRRGNMPFLRLTMTETRSAGTRVLHVRAAFLAQKSCNVRLACYLRRRTESAVYVKKKFAWRSRTAAWKRNAGMRARTERAALTAAMYRRESTTTGIPVSRRLRVRQGRRRPRWTLMPAMAGMSRKRLGLDVAARDVGMSRVHTGEDVDPLGRVSGNPTRGDNAP